MMNILINLGLLGAAVFFYLGENLSAAIIAVAFFAYRILQIRLARVASVLGRLESVPDEHAANVALSCRFSIENAVHHESVATLFRHLQSRGKLSSTTLDEWRSSLVENYRRKYGRSSALEEVTFNVKSNLLFKNGTPEFRDAVYHSIEIPYSLREDGTQDERHFMTPAIEEELEIRLLLINGFLVLQLGEFDKASTPHLIRDGSLAIYETYVTLTAFPFLYFASRHGLPTRYLNLSAGATESYKASLVSLGTSPKRSFWKRRPDRYDDWQQLHAELRAYRVLADQSDSANYSYSTYAKLSSDFESKRGNLLQKAGFQTFDRDRDESWRYPDTGEVYWNDYLHVGFQDLNSLRDYALRKWFIDYHEEQP